MNTGYQGLPHTLRKHSSNRYAKSVWISQYFEPRDAERRKEIELVITLNCENPQIDEIVLLNEQAYETPLLQHPKITQINIGCRLTYKAVFDFTNERFGDEVLILLSNLDIAFDPQSLEDIKRLDLGDKVLALTRYDITDLGTRSSRLFRYFDDVSCSQDTWIYAPLRRDFSADCHIYLGIPGCDGRICHLLDQMGITVINPCLTIKTYHYHLTELRTYDRDLLSYEHLAVKYLEYGSLKYDLVTA